ncbi:MAG: hypothetical protein ACI30P_07280, partial [Muribaculaceae bacterium]
LLSVLSLRNSQPKSGKDTLCKSVPCPAKICQFQIKLILRRLPIADHFGKRAAFRRFREASSRAALMDASQ